MEQDINVVLLDDATVEADESLAISLMSEDPSVDIVNTTSLLVIVDDDGESIVNRS